MHSVTIRFPREFVNYVRRMARQRHVNEAVIWRELVATGIHRSDLDDGLQKTAFNLSVQTLCITRRLAGHTFATSFVRGQE